MSKRPPVHNKIPNDLRNALENTPNARVTWEGVTSLARGEWICWITSPKKEETRAKRIRVAIDKLSKGDRRPCCWPGCPHR